MEHDLEIGLAKPRYEAWRIEQRIRDEEIEETNYGMNKQRKKMKIEEQQKEEEKEIIEDAKSRQIYDPLTHKFNYSKRCVTDLRENKSVTLPKCVDEKLESELSILRELMIKEFKDYKK